MKQKKKLVIYLGGGKTSEENKWDIVEYIEAYTFGSSFDSMSGSDFSRTGDNNNSIAKSLRGLKVKWIKQDNYKVNL